MPSVNRRSTYIAASSLGADPDMERARGGKIEIVEERLGAARERWLNAYVTAD